MFHKNLLHFRVCFDNYRRKQAIFIFAPYLGYTIHRTERQPSFSIPQFFAYLVMCTILPFIIHSCLPESSRCWSSAAAVLWPRPQREGSGRHLPRKNWSLGGIHRWCTDQAARGRRPYRATERLPQPWHTEGRQGHTRHWKHLVSLSLLLASVLD